MASSRSYLQYVLDQLSFLDGISHRPMMGEYLLYYQGTLFGGIYDNRFLIKSTVSARRLLPYAVMESPYDGAKEMILITNTDREVLSELIPAVTADLMNKKG